jgi:hypothetical protein
MRKTLIATALAIGLVAVPASSAFASTTTKFVGKAKATLTVTDATAGTFNIDGTAKIRNLGDATVHGEGVRTDANSASYSLTITTANGDTITTTSTANGLRVGQAGVFLGHSTITGGTGAFAGATGTATTVGAVKKIKATPGTFKTKIAFRGKITV